MCNTNETGINICVNTTNIINHFSVAQYPLMLTA